MAEAGATLDLADRTREADQPHSLVVRFAASNPLRLDAGVDFAPLQIAYQTYGTLNAARTMSRTVMTGKSNPHGMPVAGLVDAGPDEPMQPPTTLGQITK